MIGCLRECSIRDRGLGNVRTAIGESPRADRWEMAAAARWGASGVMTVVRHSLFGADPLGRESPVINLTGNVHVYRRLREKAVNVLRI